VALEKLQVAMYVQLFYFESGILPLQSHIVTQNSGSLSVTRRAFSIAVELLVTKDTASNSDER